MPVHGRLCLAGMPENPLNDNVNEFSRAIAICGSQWLWRMRCGSRVTGRYRMRKPVLTIIVVPKSYILPALYILHCPTTYSIYITQSRIIHVMPLPPTSVALV